MATFGEGVVKKTDYDTKEGQLHFRITRPIEHLPSSTTTPVLIFHLAASSSKSCVALMPCLFSHGFSCFAPDMPGFGESFNPKDDPPNVGWYYSSLYHDVFNSMPKFHNGCHIISHHAGAVIGPDSALSYPGFVHSLLLVGSAVLTFEERKRMAEKNMAPFNIPVADGTHLKKTWDYLIQLGVPASNLHLLQREALNHARAWQGRTHIHACA